MQARACCTHVSCWHLPVALMSHAELIRAIAGFEIHYSSQNCEVISWAASESSETFNEKVAFRLTLKV